MESSNSGQRLATGRPAADALAALNPAALNYATQAVEILLAAARDRRASDVHFLPAPGGLDVRWRIDGALSPVAFLPSGAATSIIARLKVLAGLLTYCLNRPQEGRFSGEGGEVRVCTMPTLHGEQAVLRLFAAAGTLERLDDLGLDEPCLLAVKRLLAETGGAFLICGPAGSGKTTTAYACLRELQSAAGGLRGIATLEDPIESQLPGAAQSAANPAGGFDLPSGLKFLLRQDPEVIFVGEVRDKETAALAFEAALTGHLVLTTFHASSAAAALARLAEMRLPPYALTSGLIAVLCQRLARRLCEACSRPADARDDALGLEVSQARMAVGCSQCGGTGYNGRLVLAELMPAPIGPLRAAILNGSDAAELERAAIAQGMAGRWTLARRAVEAGVTSCQEIRRVLGLESHG